MTAPSWHATAHFYSLQGVIVARGRGRPFTCTSAFFGDALLGASSSHSSCLLDASAKNHHPPSRSRVLSQSAQLQFTLWAYLVFDTEASDVVCFYHHGDGNGTLGTPRARSTSLVSPPDQNIL